MQGDATYLQSVCTRCERPSPVCRRRSCPALVGGRCGDGIYRQRDCHHGPYVPHSDGRDCTRRVIGTIRRECLDWCIPLSEAHLRQTFKAWVTHYNRGRPHTALGPGAPDPPASLTVPLSSSRHRLDDFRSVHAKAILGGLHHEYSLARA
ncbi:integrase core domain-containing protein [Peristeroidobacter soli]|uniref:integrase core domain-containing protein n=1 Tax=Peristeroidobacter soli TaxID=2497877 RepID=UPI00101C2846